MAKRGKKKRRRGKRAATARATSREVPWRNVAIGGVIGLALVVVVVIVAVVSKPKEPQRNAEVVYHDIRGGFTEEGLPYLGSPDADVVVTEFTDLYCSHCRTYSLESEDSILADYVTTGKIRYVLHYYSNGSPQSLQATDAAMCAADQGLLYFQFQRAFFENSATTREDFVTLARELGLNEDEFASCWDAGRFRNTLIGHIQAARAMGVSSTPTFKINDQFVVGNRPEVLRQTIEDELASD